MPIQSAGCKGLLPTHEAFELIFADICVLPFEFQESLILASILPHPLIVRALVTRL